MAPEFSFHGSNITITENVIKACMGKEHRVPSIYGMLGGYALGPLKIWTLTCSTIYPSELALSLLPSAD